MQTDFTYDCTQRFVQLCALRASRFTGKERDTESGLDYFGARYYASNMGRWMSPDWSAKEEPVPYAKLDDPQSLNLYSYVKNNPLRFVDADGHTDVAAVCAKQASCSVTVDQHVSISNGKNPDSIIDIKTNFTKTTDANGVVSFTATSTATNLSRPAFSSSQLSQIGSTVGAIQGAGVQWGLGANTTQLLTAFAAKESTLGAGLPAAGQPPTKNPFINPLQLSGNRETMDRMHNIQGGLYEIDRNGRRVDFDPRQTYSGFNGNPNHAVRDAATNIFMHEYSGIVEAVTPH